MEAHIHIGSLYVTLMWANSWYVSWVRWKYRIILFPDILKNRRYTKAMR